MEISTELGDDMVKIMSGADQSKISSSMKFIWEEKQKYLKSSSAGIRHYPVIFRYCLSPAAKSSGAYDETRCDEKKLLVSQFSQVAVVTGLQKLYQTRTRI